MDYQMEIVQNVFVTQILIGMHLLFVQFVKINGIHQKIVKFVELIVEIMENMIKIV